MATIPTIASIAHLAADTDVWFLDIWGVLHNGVEPYPGTVAACRRFRAEGGTVILVSNAPRPAESVVAQLNRIGVDVAAYDSVVTSGDVSVALVEAARDQRIFHIGPERDRALFAGLPHPPSAGAPDCDVAVCTGLYDDEAETPANYEHTLRALRSRDVPMICANPDQKVERGGRIIYCAGAIATAYEALGGLVSYAGKPYLPIYDMALQSASDARRGKVEKTGVLAIGDGVATDIEGAGRFGIRSVYVASGVHVRIGETLADAVARLFGGTANPPVAAMPMLAW